MKQAIGIVFLLLCSQVYAMIKIEGLDLRNQKKIEVNFTPGRAKVFYFLSAWCPCSKGTFEHLNSLRDEFKDFDFIGFHSSVAIPEEDAIEYFKKYQIHFPIINDPEVKYADYFKALKTPHVFVYGANDELLYQGAATNSRDASKATKFYLKDALALISQGKAPEEKNVKALGCYIQR